MQVILNLIASFISFIEGFCHINATSCVCLHTRYTCVKTHQYDGGSVPDMRIWSIL